MLHVCGCGITPEEDITLKTIKILQNSDTILFLCPIDDNFLKQFNLQEKNLVDLYQIYENGKNDRDVYQSIQDKIISEIKSIEGDVSVLMIGHPRIGVTITSMIEKEVHPSQYLIHPGISSFDTMTIDLNVDPIGNGALLIDANRLILHESNICSSYDIFIYHASSVGTMELNYKDPEKNRRLDILTEELMKTYNQKKTCYLISSSHNKDQPPELTKCTVGNIPEMGKKLHFACTIYIPREEDVYVNLERLSMYG